MNAWLRALLLLALLSVRLAQADTTTVTLIGTTTIEDSGLLGVLVPALQKGLGISIRALSMGTGQALSTAREGEVDVLLVHDPIAEAQFVRDGYALRRAALMHNYFLLAGPRENPANIQAEDATSSAFHKIAESEAASFVSRGDNSGTHQRERILWVAAGLDPLSLHTRYREAGAGMGQTLLIADSLGAYTLVDQATWAFFAHKSGLRVLLGAETRAELRNDYSVILVNHPARSAAEQAGGKRIVEWLLGDSGQQLITNYRIDGVTVFFAD